MSSNVFSFVSEVEEGKTEAAERQSLMEQETGFLRVLAANSVKLATLCIRISEMLSKHLLNLNW